MVELEIKIQMVPSNGGHYSHQSGGCASPHGAQSGGDGNSPDDPHGAGSDTSSQNLAEDIDMTDMLNQFKPSMTAMNSSLIDLLHC